MKIIDIANINTEKIESSLLTRNTYISTENMLSNCGGVEVASSIPTGKVTSFCSDDTLISNIRPYFKKVWYARFNGGCSNDVICVRTKSETCLPAYLYYALCTDKFIDTFSASSKGTKMPRGDKNALLSYEIPDRTIAEQQHIVDILGSIDDSIENNEKIIEALEEKMLLEYDHLITSTALAESEMQEIFDISIGKTPPRKESHWFTENSEDVKWLSISDMGKAKVFTFDSSEKITAEGIKKYNVKIVPENTVLLSFKLTIGKVAITGCEMATNEAIAHFVTDDNTIMEYLYCYLKRYNFDTLGNTSSIATAVNSKTIKAMKFKYPSKEAISEFHRIAEPIIKKIKHLLITNAKLNELKQLYLKKFFG